MRYFDLNGILLRSIRCICTMIVLLLFAVTYGVGQQMSYNDVDGRTNAINTAVPFLRIGPDARSGAMGDAGVALSPDANAVFWNLSKIPFASHDMGVSVSYTPWLQEMANDVFLTYLSGYKKLDDLQAVGVSVRYFDMGNIQLTNFQGEDQGRTHPREFSIDGGYARKLSDHWSLGVALRFIHSDLASGVKQGGTSTFKAGNALAGDLSVYYISRQQDTVSGQGTWSFGATLTNLGTKIGYTEDKSDKYFIPSNMAIGGAYTYQLSSKNKITLALDVNKLLVPTPDTIDNDHDGIPDYRQKNVVSGLFGSFGDAPGGFKEEFHELMYSIGAEYWYNDLFAVRAGYYSEYKTKGDRKYLTVGVGLKYKMAGLNFSYLIPSGGDMQRSPLSNTLRLSISVSK
ncbi:MAG TPA: type IX secretion system outer membrane channel protein PorV [Chitinophagaceae bacterium]|nr:type IX secretion system outer membrane channel protein PorV [Chitinophagaceae bacterium]